MVPQEIIDQLEAQKKQLVNQLLAQDGTIQAQINALNQAIMHIKDNLKKEEKKFREVIDGEEKRKTKDG